jgi:hypothetical protein
MKCLLVLISFYLMTVISLGEAHAGPEGWKKEWVGCQGYVKIYYAGWHTHPSTQKYQHLMKSVTSPVNDPQFSTYTPHPDSPWFEIWSACEGPLQTSRWYFFDACVENVWSYSGHCWDSVVVRFIGYDSTYPQPCAPP